MIPDTETDPPWAAFMAALEGIHTPSGPTLADNIYSAPVVAQVPAKLGMSISRVRALFGPGQAVTLLALPTDGPTIMVGLKKVPISIRRNGVEVKNMALCFSNETAMNTFQEWAGT